MGAEHRAPPAAEQPLDPSPHWEPCWRPSVLGTGLGSAGSLAWGLGVPVPGRALPRLSGTRTHRQIWGEKDSQSGWEANVSRHGNWVRKHHQNVSNEGN